MELCGELTLQEAMDLSLGNGVNGYINLYAPRFLYIGQAFRYSPENAFYIFNQQIYFII